MHYLLLEVIFRYTQNDGTLYAFTFQWPSNNVLTLGSVTATEESVVTLLGDKESRILDVSKLQNYDVL